MSVRVLNSKKRELGEGPHWMPASNQLLTVDIDKQVVEKTDFSTGETVETHPFDDKTSAAIPYASDASLLVVTVGNQVFKYDTKTKQIIETLCDVSEHANGIVTRINDAKCDPYGRLIFGTMPKTFDEDYAGNKGKLYSFSKGDLKILIDEVGLSNGLAWSRDNQTMFYIDSIPAKKLYAYDYSQEGAITNQRVLVDFRQEPFSEFGVPDGMTIDVQDNIWLATFGGSGVLHIDSRTGKMLRRISIPSVNTTSVCFGGPDLSTLLVTAAGVHNVPKDVCEENGGCIFAVSDLGTKGRQPVDFSG